MSSHNVIIIEKEISMNPEKRSFIHSVRKDNAGRRVCSRNCSTPVSGIVDDVDDDDDDEIETLQYTNTAVTKTRTGAQEEVKTGGGGLA